VILRLDYFAIYSIHDSKSQLPSRSQQRTVSRPESGRRQQGRTDKQDVCPAKAFSP